ncbi:glycosyltransferase [Pasteurella sp. PK-2025]|uniref:glycosyltransferase n=1 Tax=Pasteurella sp. PK-2025 TaxID=3413133 RepID=UPI003C760ECE
MKKQVWFWQLILSPHMVNVAFELAKFDVEVHYVVAEIMCDERAKLGWNQHIPENMNIHIHILDKKSFLDLLPLSNENAIHILQGIRGNGYVTELMQHFHAKNQPFWIIMETVELVGLNKLIKPYLYKYLFNKYKKNISGILAIGHRTKKWIAQLGSIENHKIYPFAYFLLESQLPTNMQSQSLKDKFTLIYAGTLKERKCPTLIVDALSRFPLEEQEKIQLWFVGDGPLKNDLAQALAKTKITPTFFGNIPIEQVREYMSNADCLVLPSQHDGWGAVTTEALIEGTPVICSDACGSAETILCSKQGGVFKAMLTQELYTLLKKQFSLGKVRPEQRHSLKEWAKSLTAQAGAKYLFTILFTSNKEDAPWKNML